MSLPSRAYPATIKRIPAITDATISPSKPYLAITSKITTTNAPVGPPICTLVPPKNEMKKPATTAVTRPLSGDAPDEVDGQVIFTSEKDLEIGSFVQVQITEAKTFDLVGICLES